MLDRPILSSPIYLLSILTVVIYSLSQHERVEARQLPSVDASDPALTRQIASLLDLTPDRHNLVTAAIDRAIASKQSGASEPQIDGGKPLQPRSQQLPKSKTKSQPSPNPRSQSDRPSQQSPEIIGQMRRSPADR